MVGCTHYGLFFTFILQLLFLAVPIEEMTENEMFLQLILLLSIHLQGNTSKVVNCNAANSLPNSAQVHKMVCICRYVQLLTCDLYHIMSQTIFLVLTRISFYDTLR